MTTRPRNITTTTYSKSSEHENINLKVIENMKQMTNSSQNVLVTEES